MNIETQALQALTDSLSTYIDSLIAEDANRSDVSLPEFRNRLRAYNLCKENIVYSLDYLRELISERQK